MLRNRDDVPAVRCKHALNSRDVSQHPVRGTPGETPETIGLNGNLFQPRPIQHDVNAQPVVDVALQQVGMTQVVQRATYLRSTGARATTSGQVR